MVNFQLKHGNVLLIYAKQDSCGVQILKQWSFLASYKFRSGQFKSVSTNDDEQLWHIVLAIRFIGLYVAQTKKESEERKLYCLYKKRHTSRGYSFL